MSIAVLNHQPHNSVLETTIVMPKSSCRNLRLYNIIIKFIKLCSSYYILFHSILQYCICLEKEVKIVLLRSKIVFCVTKVHANPYA